MMQDLPQSSTNANNISGKMDSNTNANTNTNVNNNNQNADDSQSEGTMSSLKRYLPIVKWVGTSTKDFFVSGQFKRTIRSPVQFVNPRHLSMPQTVGDALTRLAKNWGFYKSNYAIITFLCCFAWIFSSGSSLIVLALLFLMWFYTIKTSNSTLKIGEHQYGPMQKYMFSIFITLIAMLLFGIIGTLMSGISVGAGISSLHAVCHIRPHDEHEQLRNLNDVEKDGLNNSSPHTIQMTGSATNNSKYNETLNSITNNGNLTSVNGLDIMQMSDTESYPVHDAMTTQQTQMNNNNNDNINNDNINVNNNSYNDYNNYGNGNNNNNHHTTQSIFENSNDNGTPELGIH